MNAKKWCVAIAMLLGLAGISRGAQTFTGTVIVPGYDGSFTPLTSLTFTLTCSSGPVVKWQEPFTIQANGSFSVTRSAATASGTYSFFVKGPHFLQRANNIIPVNAGGAGQMFFSLQNGDVDGDDVVSVFDYIRLSDAFDTMPADANWDADADLDGDGVVSVFDYIILSDNFDRQGEQPA